MTLVTTPGASDADSYAGTSEADAYFSARGVSAWTGSTSVKEAALRVATSYLDNAYRERWIGLTSTQTQSLSWPRVDGTRGNVAIGGGVGFPAPGGYLYGWTFPLFDINGWPIAIDAVPLQVKTATMEAALLVVGSVTLEPRLERGGQIESIDQAVGPLREAIKYRSGAPAIDRITVIEGLLRGLVTSSPGAPSGNTRLVRA